jgi:hypothetical protein
MGKGSVEKVWHPHPHSRNRLHQPLATSSNRPTKQHWRVEGRINVHVIPHTLMKVLVEGLVEGRGSPHTAADEVGFYTPGDVRSCP